MLSVLQLAGGKGSYSWNERREEKKRRERESSVEKDDTEAISETLLVY